MPACRCARHWQRSSTNSLKHLGVQAQEKSEDPKEVTNQHTSLVGYSAELVVKGNSHQVFNSHQPKPCKCGFQQSHNQSFQFISKKDERLIFLCKIGLCKPPPPRHDGKRGSQFLRRERFQSTPHPPRSDWEGGS